MRSVRATSIGVFFILLFAVPTGNIGISGAGIVNFLIYLNNPRLLAILFLLPALFTARGFGPRQLSACAMPDRLVVVFVFLSTALSYRSSDASVTGVLRTLTVYALDVLIPYFAFSRTVTSLADLRKVFCAIIVAVLPLSLIAVFETLKRWHLYYALSTSWGIESASYAERGGMLRASASAVDSITLGFVILVAIGCLLGIWQTIRSSQLRAIASVIFATGLVSTLARGPWVG